MKVVEVMHNHSMYYVTQGTTSEYDNSATVMQPLIHFPPELKSCYTKVAGSMGMELDLSFSSYVHVYQQTLGSGNHPEKIVHNHKHPPYNSTT